MVLSKPDIESELEADRLKIDPFPSSSQIEPISINLKHGLTCLGPQDRGLCLGLEPLAQSHIEEGGSWLSMTRCRALIVRSRQLKQDHHAVLREIFVFLGVAEDVEMPRRSAFSGELHGKRRHPVLSWMLRLSYLAERRRVRGLYDL